MVKHVNGNLRFKNVAVIDLHGCGKVSDDNIEILTSVFKHLEVLRIGNNSDISDRGQSFIRLFSSQLETKFTIIILQQ